MWLCLCPSGPLSIPTVPSIPGLQDFKGTTMHTAAWDSSIELAGKKVGSNQYLRLRAFLMWTGRGRVHSLHCWENAHRHG